MNKYQQGFADLEKRVGRRLSFLEIHYVQNMEAGGDHAEYVVVNDIDDDKRLCDNLKDIYGKYQKVKQARKVKNRK